MIFNIFKKRHTWRLILHQTVKAWVRLVNPQLRCHDVDDSCANAKNCEILQQCHIIHICIRGKPYVCLPCAFLKYGPICRLYHIWGKVLGLWRELASYPICHLLYSNILDMVGLHIQTSTFQTHVYHDVSGTFLCMKNNLKQFVFYMLSLNTGRGSGTVSLYIREGTVLVPRPAYIMYIIVHINIRNNFIKCIYLQLGLFA